MDEIGEIDLSSVIIDLSNAPLLGEGSFGDVFRVEKYGRQIAVKTLKNRWITQPDGQRGDRLPDFRKECDILVELKHPNIIKTIGGSENILKDQQSQFGILTEYCERGTLRDLIFNRNVLYSMRNVAVWSENLFDALGHIFRTKSIIHRDINTNNIFVTKDFVVKLGDFGTTREIDQTRSGTFDVGTWRYRSPPQLGSNKTSEEMLNQGTTASSRNDVYAMGLVIWQLIERRLVFAEYGTEGKFDLAGFIADVVLGKLKELKPPKCIKEFREMVESCCNFNRLARPKIEKILKQLREFTTKNNLNDLNDGYPREDQNQQVLIHPIGFDKLESRELIPVPEHSEKDADTLIAESKLDWNEDLRKEFIKRFDEMAKVQKMAFIHEIDIYLDAVKENSKYVHEYIDPWDFRRIENDKKNFGEMDIRQIFKEVVAENQNREMWFLQELLIEHSLHCMKGHESRNFAFWGFCFERKNLVACVRRQIQKRTVPSSLKFKSFVSANRNDKWILIREYGEYVYLGFSSESFDKYWSLKARSYPGDPNLYLGHNKLISLRDFTIQKEALVQSLEETIMSWQRQRNPGLSEIHPGKVTQGTVKNIPIEGYLFQLSNPPRIACNHETKCDPRIQVPNDGGLQYYSCSSKRQINYLSLWMKSTLAISEAEFHRLFKRLQKVPLYEPPTSENSETPNSDPLVFLQVFDSHGEYITLLDFSDQYFNEPSVPYLDSDYMMDFTDGPSLHKFFLETPENQRKCLVLTLREGEWQMANGAAVLNGQGKGKMKTRPALETSASD